MVASRQQSDRLALTGRGGNGVVAYRSEFLHLWVVADDSVAPLDGGEVREAIVDLEREAHRLPAGVMPPPGIPLPVEVQHILAGLQFLRDSLWDARCDFAGLIAWGGRAWAIRAGLEVSLEQLTGAPVRWRWHDWEGGSTLAWTDLGAAEVWRLGIEHAAGTLYAHYRPALAPLAHAPATDADAFAAAAQAQAQAEAVSREVPRVTIPARPAVPRGPAPRVGPRPGAGPRLEAGPRPAPRPIPRSTPRPARRLPAPWVSRRVLLAAGLACAVLALAAAAIWARRPISALMVGRYTLELRTSPAGARVQVDGKPVAGRTPLALPLEPGQHRVELTYGDYASASTLVEGARGDVVRRDYAWTGSLGVASADSSVRLAVAFDGKPMGIAPLWQDSLPVGRHRLAFSASGVRAWEEEVQIRSGQSARVSATPVKVPPYGLVTARAQLVSSDGVEDMDDLPVFVDGARAGVTPVDLKLAPGPHSIKIARGAFTPSIHLLDVQAGGRFYASAVFGRPADPLVAFEPPPRLSRGAPATLSVRLDADLPLPVRQAALHFRAGSGPFARIPIVWTVVAGHGQGTVAFPVESLGAATTATYYVEIETREGEEYFSELHTVPIVP